MVTQPKPYYEGYWYHAYPRAREGVRLFESDEEREWFVDKLDETFARRQIGLGSLCLMETHYHVLVRMGPVPLDRAFQGLHAAYVKYVNQRRNRSGSLFQKHPSIDVVLDDEYFLQLVPSIHIKPVNKGIVDDPLDYDWSTDSLYRIGKWILGSFDCWTWPPKFQGEDRGRLYRERMNETIEPPERGNGYVGTREEWKDLLNGDHSREDEPTDDDERRSIETIARDVAEEERTTVKALKQPGRTQPEARIRQRVMYEMYREGYGPQEIGDFFNRNKGTVVHAVQKNTPEEDE